MSRLRVQLKAFQEMIPVPHELWAWSSNSRECSERKSKWSASRFGESQCKTWNNKRAAALQTLFRVLIIYTHIFLSEVYYYWLLASAIMPGVWQRHPRCTFLILVVLATTLYLLVPINHESTVQPLFNMIDNDLPNRMERAHHIYSKVLENRKKLIDRFGPTPKDIPVWVADHFLGRRNGMLIWGSFPEDKAPWPPYTVCASCCNMIIWRWLVVN